MYRSDYDDYIPPWKATTFWSQLLLPYSKTDVVFRCPTHLRYKNPSNSENIDVGTMSIGINGAESLSFFNQWNKGNAIRNASTLVYSRDSAGVGPTLKNSNGGQYVNASVCV